MIIISFLVFVFMLVWGLASVLFIVVPLVSSMDDNGVGFGTFCAAILSLVCWYQVIVWGKPWFAVLAQAWM